MKNNKLLVVLVIVLSLLVIGLGGFIFYGNILAGNNKNNFDDDYNVGNNNQLTGENKISADDISERKLKNIIEKQLFIVFKYNNPITKIEDIDNQSKLLLTLSILEDSYTTNSNDINTTIVSITKSKLEDAFNSSVISNTGIKHENFDVYKLNGDYYNRDTDLLVYSKEMYKYMLPHASKVKSYEKNNNQYIISMNYLFPDGDVGFEYYYGSLTDVKNGTNSIVKAYDDNGTYLNAQQYLDNNYNNIKDKLTTYNYTFEVKNNKLILTNFSIK